MAPLPANSWLLEVADGRVERQLGGANVELSSGLLAEGAWTGDFSGPGALASRFRCGSGIVFGDGRLTIFTPSHPLEPVYLYAPSDQRRVLISNSAHFIVAVEPEAHPDSLEDARRRSSSSIDGAASYDRVIATSERGNLFRLAWGEFTLDLNTMALRESGVIAPGIAPFSDYAGCRAHLQQVMRDIVLNARDGRRTRSYGPLVATCSSGYDSASTTVLAREAGAELAVTLATARGGGNDSGVPVAVALGLRCVEFPRFGTDIETVRPDDPKRLARIDGPSVAGRFTEFLASLNVAQDLVCAPFGPPAEGGILTTGFQGSIWERGTSVEPLVRRRDNSGSGFDEFRKRFGFVHVPLPFAVARYAGTIRTISNSAEMAPWRVTAEDALKPGPGHTRIYDKPIPRRILEEAGVDRRAFGQRKSAASLLIREQAAVRNAAFGELVRRYREAL